MKNTKKEKEEEKRCAACVCGATGKRQHPFAHCRAAYTRNESPGGTR